MYRTCFAATAVIVSSAMLIHCSSAGPTQTDPTAQTQTDTADAGGKGQGNAQPPPATSTATYDAGSAQAVDSGPIIVDAGPQVDARPPPPADAAPPPIPTTPGPQCTALASCCNALTGSSAASCVQIADKKEENMCKGAYSTFGCGGGGTGGGTLGPNCAQLASCCNYDLDIQGDPQCQVDWRSGNEGLCYEDLIDYQNDPWGDCL